MTSTTNWIELFNSYISREHLIAQGQRVLLAVSGGRDSAAMAYLFHCSDIDFAIAHCNFHLRPGDCDCDETFVRTLACQYGVEFFVAQFDTEHYSKTHSLSIEEAARELRYNFFDELCRTNGFDLVATAHHQDDSVETFFINLIRGTGIRGLRGIAPHRDNIIRPMLCFSRDDIDSIVEEYNLSYVEDYTNGQQIYLRNRIRHGLVPMFKDISPKFDLVMRGNLHRLSGNISLYELALKQLLSSLLVKDGEDYIIDVDNLLSLIGEQRDDSQLMDTLVFELFFPFGFNESVCKEIVSGINGQSGAYYHSPTHVLIRDRNRLLLTPLDSFDVTSEYIIDIDSFTSSNPAGITFTIVDSLPSFKLPATEACFDFDKIKFPLTLRHWKDGDRFSPFGMNGSRLLSDYFSDAKLSLLTKHRKWLLCDSDGTILWVVGMRASRHYAVSSETAIILHLVLDNNRLFD